MASQTPKKTSGVDEKHACKTLVYKRDIDLVTGVVKGLATDGTFPRLAAMAAVLSLSISDATINAAKEIRDILVDETKESGAVFSPVPQAEQLLELAAALFARRIHPTSDRFIPVKFDHQNDGCFYLVDTRAALCRTMSSSCLVNHVFDGSKSVSVKQALATPKERSDSAKRFSAVIKRAEESKKKRSVEEPVVVQKDPKKHKPAPAAAEAVATTATAAAAASPWSFQYNISKDDPDFEELSKSVASVMWSHQFITECSVLGVSERLRTGLAKLGPWHELELARIVRDLEHKSRDEQVGALSAFVSRIYELSEKHGEDDASEDAAHYRNLVSHLYHFTLFRTTSARKDRLLKYFGDMKMIKTNVETAATLAHNRVVGLVQHAVRYAKIGYGDWYVKNHGNPIENPFINAVQIREWSMLGQPEQTLSETDSKIDTLVAQNRATATRLFDVERKNESFAKENADLKQRLVDMEKQLQEVSRKAEKFELQYALYENAVCAIRKTLDKIDPQLADPATLPPSASGRTTTIDPASDL